MAVFEPGVPVRTREPRVQVDGGLRPGSYRFSLVVQNDRGQISQADEVVVVVVRTS